MGFLSELLYCVIHGSAIYNVACLNFASTQPPTSRAIPSGRQKSTSHRWRWAYGARGPHTTVVQHIRQGPAGHIMPSCVSSFHDGSLTSMTVRPGAPGSVKATRRAAAPDSRQPAPQGCHTLRRRACAPQVFSSAWPPWFCVGHASWHQHSPTSVPPNVRRALVSPAVWIQSGLIKMTKLVWSDPRSS